VDATASTAKLNPREWKAYNDAKPAAEWRKQADSFSKPPASLSDGAWKLSPALSGVNASLRTDPAVANGLGGRLNTERNIPGEVLAYQVLGPHWMKDSGAWALSFDVSNGSRTISLKTHRLSSSQNRAGGFPKGYFSAYWAPDKSGVALEWTYWPITGAGEWTEFIYRPLPN
jgi:hypothetical protein